MAAAKKPAGKPAAKGAAGKGKKKSNQMSNIYEVSGDSVKRKNKSCPKCGPGIFMGAHKDRWSCGKCGFMEKK